MRARSPAAVLLVALAACGASVAAACSSGFSFDLLPQRHADAGSDASPSSDPDEPDALDAGVDAAPPPHGFGWITASTGNRTFVVDSTFYDVGRAEALAAPAPAATASSASADCALRLDASSPDAAAPPPPSGPRDPRLVAPTGGAAVLTGVGGAKVTAKLDVDGGESSVDFPVTFHLDDGASQILVSVQGSDAVPDLEAAVSLAPAVALVDPAAGTTIATDGSDLTVRWNGDPADALLFALIGPTGSVDCTLHPTTPGVAVVPGALVQTLFAGAAPKDCNGDPGSCAIVLLSNQRTTSVHAGAYELELAHVSEDGRLLPLP